MATFYYIAPWVNLFAKGGGRFGLIGPGRPTNGSKCMIYGQWDQGKGTRCSTVSPTSPFGQQKNFCLTRVEGPDSLHQKIAGDTSIIRLPISSESLDNNFESLDPNSQTNLKNKLEELRIDSSTINGKTKLREIVAQITKVLFASKVLGSDYPEFDLNQKMTRMSTAARLRMISFLRNKNINTKDINANTSVRQLANKFKDIKWGKIVIGPDKLEE